jgi:UDP-N-acetylmuramate--alanine ligase
MNIDKIKKAHFIGIKGVGMSMLAQFLASQGVKISGSDVAEDFLTARVLSAIKADIKIGFSPNNIPPDAEAIIYSTAYNGKNNPEVAAAKELKPRLTLTFAQALAKIFNSYWGIAVVGSHGKTTTTAWLGHTLAQAGLKPNVMVGSFVEQWQAASLSLGSEILIIEADEYQNKLSQFQPRAVVLNNIDYDHPDFFPTPQAYEQVFVDFIKKIPKRGFLVANMDDKAVKRLAPVNCRGKIIGYGLAEKNKAGKQADKDFSFLAFDRSLSQQGQFFKVKMRQNDQWQDLGEFNIRLLGKHNIYNALAVIAASIELDADLAKIRAGLADFLGTARRAQVLGKFRGALIIDDYAHHPTEVKATLLALKEKYKDKNLVVVFHPHTFTRTKALLADFSKSFFAADQVIVLDIYGSARETQGGIKASDLVKAIKEVGHKQVRHIPSLSKAEDYLRSAAGPGDVIVLMGAGDVFRIGENLIK